MLKVKLRNYGNNPACLKSGPLRGRDRGAERNRKIQKDRKTQRENDKERLRQREGK